MESERENRFHFRGNLWIGNYRQGGRILPETFQREPDTAYRSKADARRKLHKTSPDLPQLDSNDVSRFKTSAFDETRSKRSE